MMKTPKVRLAQPTGRPYQLRYYCPVATKEIRISTGTRDWVQAEEQKRQLEAKLLLGIQQNPVKVEQYGPNMSWERFREEYSTRYLSTLRPKSADDAESRLDVAERIVNPLLLCDMAKRETLETLQSQLLAGVESRYKQPRSPHTVRTSMAVVTAALNWACECGWLEYVPKVRKVKTSKLRAAKGRPVTEKEFKEMLRLTPVVVGKPSTDSWRFLLRGLWESGLRLEELLNVSWDDQHSIHPVWQKGKLPVLHLPAHLQKNDVEENIPLLPGFNNLLQQVKPEFRLGRVFNPGFVQHKFNRPNLTRKRLSPNWIGKVISRIGEQAGVVVHPGDARTGRPQKYASAHDLRRSCAQRMVDAGVPPQVIQRVMRHASFETTKRHYVADNVQKDAETLNLYLGTGQGAN